MHKLVASSEDWVLIHELEQNGKNYQTHLMILMKALGRSVMAYWTEREYTTFFTGNRSSARPGSSSRGEMRVSGAAFNWWYNFFHGKN